MPRRRAPLHDAKAQLRGADAEQSFGCLCLIQTQTLIGVCAAAAAEPTAAVRFVALVAAEACVPQPAAAEGLYPRICSVRYVHMCIVH